MELSPFCSMLSPLFGRARGSSALKRGVKCGDNIDMQESWNMLMVVMSACAFFESLFVHRVVSVVYGCSRYCVLVMLLTEPTAQE